MRAGLVVALISILKIYLFLKSDVNASWYQKWIGLIPESCTGFPGFFKRINLLTHKNKKDERHSNNGFVPNM